MPLSAPAIVTVVVVNAVWVWNELLIALVFLQDDDARTLTAGPDLLPGPLHVQRAARDDGRADRDRADAAALHRRPALLHPRASRPASASEPHARASSGGRRRAARMLPEPVLARAARSRAGRRARRAPATRAPPWRAADAASPGASASTGIPRAPRRAGRRCASCPATATRSRSASTRRCRACRCRRTSTGPRRRARIPAVVHAPGHWMENARLEPDLQRINARLARAGMLVLCYDPMGQGERRVGWHQHGQLAPLLAGFTSLGVMVAETLGGPRRARRPRRRRRRAPGRSPAPPAAGFVSTFAAAVDRSRGGGVHLLHPQHPRRRSCATPPTAPAGTAGSTSATRCRGWPRPRTMGVVLGAAAPCDVTVVHAVDDPPFPIAGARAVVAEAARSYACAGVARPVRLRRGVRRARPARRHADGRGHRARGGARPARAGARRARAAARARLRRHPRRGARRPGRSPRRAPRPGCPARRSPTGRRHEPRLVRRRPRTSRSASGPAAPPTARRWLRASAASPSRRSRASWSRTTSRCATGATASGSSSPSRRARSGSTRCCCCRRLGRRRAGRARDARRGRQGRGAATARRRPRRASAGLGGARARPARHRRERGLRVRAGDGRAGCSIATSSPSASTTSAPCVRFLSERYSTGQQIDKARIAVHGAGAFGLRRRCSPRRSTSDIAGAAAAGVRDAASRSCSSSARG